MVSKKLGWFLNLNFRPSSVWLAAHFRLGVVLALLSLGGCVTNPVTGKNELALVTPAQEVAIGKQNYLPAQQSQGAL